MSHQIIHVTEYNLIHSIELSTLLVAIDKFRVQHVYIYMAIDYLSYTWYLSVLIHVYNTRTGTHL